MAAIYKASDGTDMEEDDLIAYLKKAKIFNLDYLSWGFDEITGGIEEFYDSAAYYKVKSFFEKYIEV